jgi:hypothetical protein
MPASRAWAIEERMNKIPVMGTISRAYGFLLGEIGTILRLTWAPLLLAAGLSYLYGGEALQASIAAAGDPNRALEGAPAQFLIGIVGFVTGVIAMVALLRVVIFSDRKPGLYVYLWLGGAEFRLIAVLILLAIAFTAAGIGVILVFALLAALTAALPVMSVVLLLATVAIIVAAIAAVVRLSLVWPVVVAENSLGVERAWALSKGNTLRLLGVLLAVVVPYSLAAWLVFMALLGSDFPAFPAFPSVDPALANSEAAMKEAGEAFRQAWMQWQVALAKGLSAHWAEVSVLGFLANLVSTALWAGATGSAYTALAGERR